MLFFFIFVTFFNLEILLMICFRVQNSAAKVHKYLIRG